MDLDKSVGTDFFARPVDVVAEDLIGRKLTVRDASCVRAGTIVETEAYGGPDDPASHAAFKPGGRAAVMWSWPGTIYVYAAYGVYPCLNLVTDAEGVASAVLIRGIHPDGEENPIHGPGKTSRALKVTLDDHGIPWDCARFMVSSARKSLDIERTPRIGISRGVEIPWRFIAQRNPR
ncbi:MAG: DNA-3-methyladenine glycosylase [Chloroflexota bacterium]